MESRTRKSTRIIIWVIAVTMVVGFIGSSFLMMFGDSQPQNSPTQLTDDTEQVDPNAFKVDGPVTQLGVTDLRPGNGPAVKVGDTITVHYKGTLAQSGVKFDSSYDRGEPATFPLQEASATQQGVISGWVMGMDGMQAGGKRRLVIPAALAYGEQEQGSVPANSDLVFEVELLSITPPASQ